ncbi:YncE family protein [Thermodesulfobacteriota bacterium]
MKRQFALFLTVLIFLSAGVAESLAVVEWDVHKTLKIEKKPRDVVMSIKGKWIYVLTDEGEILIYASNGQLRDRISVGASIDGIKSGPREDILLLTNRKDATVQIITLNFIYNINVEGSPFKGLVDAPVVIATFNDFE